MSALPVFRVTTDGEFQGDFYLDRRLGEFRNILDPHHVAPVEPQDLILLGPPLEVGQSVRLGGGAGPIYEYTRIAPGTPAPPEAPDPMHSCICNGWCDCHKPGGDIPCGDGCRPRTAEEMSADLDHNAKMALAMGFHPGEPATDPGVRYLDSWGCQDPDIVGASEYRAIYDTLEDALTNSEEEVADPPRDFALAILDEFTGHAQALKALIGGPTPEQAQAEQDAAFLPPEVTPDPVGITSTRAVFEASGRCSAIVTFNPPIPIGTGVKWGFATEPTAHTKAVILEWPSPNPEPSINITEVTE